MTLLSPKLAGQFTHLNVAFIGMASIHFCHVDALFILPWLVEALRCRKQKDRNLKELLAVQQFHGQSGQPQKRVEGMDRQKQTGVWS